MIEFGFTECVVREGDWTEIPIVRIGNLDRHESVMISSSNGSACELDYCPIREVISFSPGIDCISYRVYTYADFLAEDDEVFRVSLLQLEPGSVGAKSNCAITILDMPRQN